MGVYKSAILTPYLEAQGSVMVTETKVRRICPQHRTKVFTDQKFCGECGAEIINQDYDQPRKITAGDIINNSRYRLYKPNHVEGVFIPVERFDGQIYLPNDGGAIELDITMLEDTAMAQVEWFEERFKEEIDSVKEIFPEARVKWGIVTYWS